LRHFAEPRQCIGHIGVALFDLFEPRLRALLGAPIVMGGRPGNRAPEQVRRGRDDVMGGELVGDRDDIGI
jgi:hypothetical protein